GLLRHAVSHQLDARDESNLTDITDMGMRPERLQQVAKDCNLRDEPLKCSLLLKDFEVRQGDRAAEWIAGIAVPMKERLELLMMSQKLVIHPFRRECCRQRHVAAGQSFANRHQIGLDLLMLTGKHAPRASEAGGHFVSNKQDVIAGGQTPKTCEVSCRHSDHAADGQ